MDIITKIVEQILNLIKSLLTSFGVNTEKVDEILGELTEETEGEETIA